jgi:folate-dependent phosphoribosylglycinamide formyltransferase PurN
VVEAEYDSGPVLAQYRCPVLPGDSVETLKTRVQERERALVVDMLAALSRGEIVLRGQLGQQ